jgi:Spy/CpxP family protein refolding chaperone
MLSRHRSRTALASVAAGIFALTVGAAWAQPPGPGPGHGPGPHGQGFGIEQTLEALKGKLSLNATQQPLWDSAAAQSSAARESGRALMQKVKDAMRAELTKPEPNFAAVAAVADDAEQQGRTLRRQARDQWLNLYATLAPAQKAIVRDAVQQRVDAMDGMRERIRQRMGG